MAAPKRAPERRVGIFDGGYSGDDDDDEEDAMKVVYSKSGYEEKSKLSTR